MNASNFQNGPRFTGDINREGIASIVLNGGQKKKRKEWDRNLMVLFYFLSSIFALLGAFPYVKWNLMQHPTLCSR